MYITPLLFLWDLSTLCVVDYDKLYYAPYLVWWTLFGSLVPENCNEISGVQMHELPQNHRGDSL